MDSLQNFNEVLPSGPTPVTEIDIKSLAEIYDEMEVYLSVYLPVTPEHEHSNQRFINSRIQTIETALQGELRTQFQETVSMVKNYLFEKPISKERGKIIFASATNSLLHVYKIGLDIEPLMVLDTSPFLLPLAKLRDDYQDYGMVLIDSQEARIFCIRSDSMMEMDRLSTNLMNKHKKGGWSQMRFNRLRKGAIKSFLHDVGKDLQKVCQQFPNRGLVIGGPGEAKNQLVEILPSKMKENVLGLIDVSMDSPLNDLMRRGDEIALEDERIKSIASAEKLKAAVLKGGLAVYGLDAVRDALDNGRVNVLIVQKDHSIPGWICERCQNLQMDTSDQNNCSRCGGPNSRVDLVEEFYELAQRTRAEVEFVDDDFLKSVGGVGALLRY